MWLDDRKVALDEVLLKCKDIQRNYEDMKNLTDDSVIKHLFKDLALQRKEWAGLLESKMREIGGLPSDIDPEREAWEALFMRAKVMLSDDERSSLLKDRENEEEELKALIDKALAQDLPKDTKVILLHIKEETKRTQKRLLAAAYTLD